ncbi:MAG: arsenosugar biosynthesis radical SAM protein ArsS [Gammaproteobacteria bacterium]|nr:arsenosugar biosynthesis radical SAM protein ArsS [Gammaproteobacteria bacterium]
MIPNTAKADGVEEEPRFAATLAKMGLGPLQRAALTQLQLNVGRLCNQACQHCHVDAGPKRTEIMTWDTIAKILEWAEQARIKQVDLTGGAPELNPHFRKLVDSFIQLRVSVTSRCNLTVLFEPHQEDLAAWYAERGVRLVCSLPCYSKSNVDAQRGNGVFAKSVRALRVLNSVGYGIDAMLPLELVYNPLGASLPPPQEALEAEYRRRLFDEFGIHFTRLLTLTNLPINRFSHFLDRIGQRQSYQQLLLDNFNLATVANLMCRHLISVDWQGRVYDCDFNQMLSIPMSGASPHYLWDIDVGALQGAPIAVGEHCFGCTAGSGSSCGGALI